MEIEKGMEAKETAVNKRACKRCLTREMAGSEAYFENLYAYIAGLDDGIKADETIYEKRLEVCRECDLLFQGMCRACGCYVELRAAVARNECPYQKW